MLPSGTNVDKQALETGFGGRNGMAKAHLELKLVWLLRLEAPSGCLGGSVVKHLPSAQVMISGSWDRAPQKEKARRVETFLMTLLFP